jgi:hypothetical protein
MRGFKAQSPDRGDERREPAGADQGVDDVGGGLLYVLFFRMIGEGGRGDGERRKRGEDRKTHLGSPDVE